MTLPPGGGATVRHPPAIAIAQLHAAGIELNASFPTAQSLGPFERSGELLMIFDGAPVLAEFGAAAIARAGGHDSLVRGYTDRHKLGIRRLIWRG